MRLSVSCTSSFRPCVRDMGLSSTFPLISRLPSICSAVPSGETLFADFAGTMQLADCPSSFIIGFRLLTFRHGPLFHLSSRATTGSPGSRSICFRTCLGSLTAQSLLRTRLLSRSAVLPSTYGESLGAPALPLFAAQYPTYAFPCQRLDCG